MRNIIECRHEDCRDSLKPWNAATNFTSPAYSVTYAVNANMISPGHCILEFGGGNLRNTLFLMSKMPTAEYHVVEKPEVVDRFRSSYKEFERRGGHLILEGLSQRPFEVIVCTYVLETICPSSQRTKVLLSLRKALRSGGIFIASFRGYPGVKGTKYEQCPAGEGYITPRRTFIKPYSMTEVRELIKATGFTSLEALQNYQVESPQNIHIKARA